jgi:NRAMP (natural resistance-associated macrophage protein)-like metal ion transporter
MRFAMSTDSTSPEVLPTDVVAPEPTRQREMWWFLGPAFVASVAYMDPGNFATNIEGGARFGYRLLWVLLWSNAMAILVQYLAAKLGISTGRTLPENCRELFPRHWTLLLWAAAEIAALATDLAEFLGAALGFYLLFGIPMLPAAILTGVVVMLILMVEQAGFQWLERVIMLFVAIIGVAYAFEVFISHPQWAPIARHVLIPEVNSSSIYIAVSMLGATVMPHVIYLHSALVLPRRDVQDRTEHHHRRMELVDVLFAMNGAWLINSAMVIMAAAVFFGRPGISYSIEGAHHTLVPLLGKFAGTAFAIALLFHRGNDGRAGDPSRISEGAHQHFPAPHRHHGSRDSCHRHRPRPSEDTGPEPGDTKLLPAVCSRSSGSAHAPRGCDGHSCESSVDYRSRVAIDGRDSCS